MLDKKMTEALNDQINEELNSAYIYQAMSADFAFKNRPGFSRWMQIQAQEEISHARKIYEYLLERGAKVELKSIPAPQVSWDSELAAYETAYAHEQHITACIDSLVNVARELDDKGTEIFLQWFVTEQIEEEANAETAIEKLKMVGGTANGLYLLDKEFGSRGAE